MLALIGLLVAGILLLTLPLLLPVGLMLMVVTVGLAFTVFWVWMLVEAIRNKGLTDNERIVWVLVIVLLHVLGALIYFFAGHPKRNAPPAGRMSAVSP